MGSLRLSPSPPPHTPHPTLPEKVLIVWSLAGGCFTYWPGGHARLHQFYREHPEQVDGRFTQLHRPEYESGDHAYQGGGERGTQLAVKAGTVLLWHGW